MPLLALITAAGLAIGASNAAVDAPRLQRLDGVQVQLSMSAGPAILMFWRPDCAPCLLELSDLKALRAAGRNALVIPVGLQPAAALRPALSRLGLNANDTLVTPEDPARLLVRFGGAPPRLPLAVAFRRSGELCGRHTGLLGRDQVRTWALTCGDVHVGR